MHVSAMNCGRAFFESYLSGREHLRILDVGGMDVNGSLRAVVPSSTWEYLAVDIELGAGVDMVLADPYAFPFAENSFDAVVTTSCFEHDAMFWLTYVEMCRVVKTGGYVYINAPSGGPYHAYPTDCWRFYPDAGLALAAWAGRCGYQVNLCESFTIIDTREPWNDFVCIHRKACERDTSTGFIYATMDVANVRLPGSVETAPVTGPVPSAHPRR